MINLSKKISLVTGGSRGIGAAIALKLAAAGSSVAITYLSDKKSALRCAAAIEETGQSCLTIKADTSVASEVRKATRLVAGRFGRIDILVNNAGIWKRGAIGEMTERQWDETLDTNLKGTFLFCNEVAPMMKKQRSGKIINLSSTAGQRGEPFYSHYAASKAGVIAFTKSISVELARFNVNANCVAPGWVETDMTADVLHDSDQLKEIQKIIPLGRVATPDDIAGAVVFLASDLANHIVGATINVNGGGVLI